MRNGEPGARRDGDHAGPVSRVLRAVQTTACDRDSTRGVAASKPPGARSARVAPEIDDGHGHRLGAVEHRPVGLRRRRACSANSGGVDRHARRRDLDHRMDRRHEVADVAHVGGADDPALDRPGSTTVATHAGRVGDVGRDHRAVVDACRRTGGRPTRARHRAARRLRRRPRGRPGPAAFSGCEAGEGVGERTYQSIAVSLGHDVRLVAALGEDAVDPLGRADVLAQRGDVHVAEHRGVERVAALVRGGGGVGGPTVVARPRAAGWRCSPSRSRSASAGWIIIAASIAVEGAPPGHDDLAATALLGRACRGSPPGRRACAATAAAARPAPRPAAAITL